MSCYFCTLQLPPTTTVSVLQSDFTIDLEVCGDTKGCYRTPSGCDVDDCDAVVTWTPSTETYIEFELQSKDEWMALGFSDDKEMVGCDLVFLFDVYKYSSISRLVL